MIFPLPFLHPHAQVLPPEMVEALRPELVVPVVEWLVHEEQPDSGAVYELGGGWVTKLRWQRTEGVAFPASYTVDDVRFFWGGGLCFRGLLALLYPRHTHTNTPTTNTYTTRHYHHGPSPTLLPSYSLTHPP